MFILKMACFVILIAPSVFASTGKDQWLQWKNKTYKEYLTKPTSFLNAESLNQAKARGRLYLNISDDGLRTSWDPKPRKNFKAVVKNNKHWGLLTRPGKKDVKITPESRTYSWPMKNGKIAEVVYGTSSGKIWSYVYNPSQIKTFSGFRFYPFDQSAIVPSTFHKKSTRKPVTYRTIQGDERKVYDVGFVSTNVRGKSIKLTAYNWQEDDEPLNYLAFIFTDSKAGKETYGGGRELVVELSAEPKDKQIISLDFNRTGNFYCAHSPFWHCPTGLQDTINVSVNAGEMNPLRKIARK